MEEDWYVFRNLLKESLRFFEDKVYLGMSNLLIYYFVCSFIKIFLYF